MNTLPEDAGWLLIALHVAAGSYTALHALLTVKDPRAAWGWIAACLLAPLAGCGLYLLLGTNRVKRRAQRALGVRDLFRAHGTLARTEPQIEGVLPQELHELLRISGVMTGRPLASGNAVQPLIDGEQTYPAMLDAIATARERVWMSSYIFSGRGIGRRLAEALGAAVKRGVDVRVLIDGFGDFYYWPRGSAVLRKFGVDVRRFQLSRNHIPLPHLNLRNHRKLLIVDRDIAFTGGINIGDHHLVRTAKKPVSDLHFRYQGSIATQLAQAFADDWATSGGEALRVDEREVAASGNSHCRTITDGPNEDADRLALILLGALANAHRRVCIMTPYFIPLPELSHALEAAALRGIDVQILLPARSNLPWVDWASRRWLRDLLKCGVRVHLSPAPFSHGKLFLMDHYYSLVGSANLDSRSLRLNFELVVENYCTALNGQLTRQFDALRERSRELTLDDLRKASRLSRVRDALCWLFSPYL